MKKVKLVVLALIWLLVIGGFGWVVSFETLEDDNAYRVSLDTNMSTRRFVSDITLLEDSTYEVAENIDVTMHTSRHGIYRYIPQKGVIEGLTGDGEIVRMPYRMKISLKSASTKAETSSENSYIMKLGDADTTVYGNVSYSLEYTMKPTVQNEDFGLVYVNVFPTRWENSLPEGSSFSLTFPKPVSRDAVKLYYGPYGSTADGQEVCDLSWEGNTLRGVLNTSLPLGSGVTVYAALGSDYFTGLSTFGRGKVGWSVFAILFAAGILVLFFLFGKDGEVIPSVQFQPPEGLDSAAVGCIVDGRPDDEDITSLILYWADQGYLTISEENSQGDMVLHRTGKSFVGQPKYAAVFFNRLFRGKKTDVPVSELENQCVDAVTAAKKNLKTYIEEKGGIYTKASKILRIVTLFLSLLPLGVFSAYMDGNSSLPESAVFFHNFDLLLILWGTWKLCRASDLWYTRDAGWRTSKVCNGLGLLLAGTTWIVVRYVSLMAQGRIPDFRPVVFLLAAVTILCALLAVWMKKRTQVCNDWMGRILGLRDFIETAELDRLKLLAEENPEWFYHILPYTYVFGLSEIFGKKLKELALPNPSWYRADYDENYRTWNYYTFHRSLTRSMNRVSTKLTSSPPSSSSGGGSDSGGFFSGGGDSGGGFSGGGFGGGGGGSW